VEWESGRRLIFGKFR